MNQYANGLISIHIIKHVQTFPSKKRDKLPKNLNVPCEEPFRKESSLPTTIFEGTCDMLVFGGVGEMVVFHHAPPSSSGGAALTCSSMGKMLLG